GSSKRGNIFDKLKKLTTSQQSIKNSTDELSIKSQSQSTFSLRSDTKKEGSAIENTSQSFEGLNTSKDHIADRQKSLTSSQINVTDHSATQSDANQSSSPTNPSPLNSAGLQERNIKDDPVKSKSSQETAPNNRTSRSEQWPSVSPKLNKATTAPARQRIDSIRSVRTIRNESNSSQAVSSLDHRGLRSESISRDARKLRTDSVSKNVDITPEDLMNKLRTAASKHNSVSQQTIILGTDQNEQQKTDIVQNGRPSTINTQMADTSPTARNRAPSSVAVSPFDTHRNTITERTAAATSPKPVDTPVFDTARVIPKPKLSSDNTNTPIRPPTFVNCSPAFDATTYVPPKPSSLSPFNTGRPSAVEKPPKPQTDPRVSINEKPPKPQSNIAGGKELPPPKPSINTNITEKLARESIAKNIQARHRSSTNPSPEVAINITESPDSVASLTVSPNLPLIPKKDKLLDTIASADSSMDALSVRSSERRSFSRTEPLKDHSDPDANRQKRERFQTNLDAFEIEDNQHLIQCFSEEEEGLFHLSADWYTEGIFLQCLF
ncbi:hypothetical protein BC833DRAFT_592110, partial [Globomyces pollinis-pini]